MAVAIACAMTGESSFAQIPCSYEVAAIIQAPASPGFSSPTRALAISPNGRYVVGFFTPNAFGFDRGYWFDTLTGEFNILPFPGSGYQSSYCNDVNDDGLIVGSLWYTIGTETQRGFVFNLNTQQFITQLMPLPGGAWCSATGINQAGTVCGTRSIGSKTDPVNPQTAFVWTQKDGFIDLGLINGFGTTASDVNNFGVVTGNMAVETILHPLTWNGSKITDLGTIAGFRTLGEAINDQGVVAGYGNIGPGFGPPVRGFAGDSSPLNHIGTLPGYERSFLVAINNAGLAVGECTAMGSSAATGILWDGQRLRDLQAMLVDPDAANLHYATAIDESGRVTCVADVALATVAMVLEPRFVQGDLTGDCAVEYSDLLKVISEWGVNGSPADLNGDGIVGVADLLTVIAHWTG